MAADAFSFREVRAPGGGLVAVPWVRITTVEPRPGRAEATARFLREAESELSRTPGQMLSAVLSARDGPRAQLCRISFWGSRALALQATSDAAHTSLRARLLADSCSFSERLMEVRAGWFPAGIEPLSSSVQRAVVRDLDAVQPALLTSA